MTTSPPEIPDLDLDDDERFEPPPSALLRVPLNAQHFHTFIAVVDAGGRLSVAAQAIGMSQPGVTHQLNELEKRLNVRLFDRARGRPARLTRPGRLFERYARNIVQLQSSLYSDLERMSRRVGGHLRVGSSSGPGEHWLPPLLLEFREQYPDLHIELHIADARSIVEQVFANDIELGFVGGSWSRSGLQFDLLFRDQLVFIAAPHHPFAARGDVTLADLAGVDMVAHEPGTGLRATLEQELAAGDLSLSHFNILAELGNQESVKSAVRAGNGVGVVWRGSAEAELQLGSLVVVPVTDFHPDSGFYVVRRAHRRLSRRSRALLDFLGGVQLSS
jgi:DNA-binding transcriptional LysR family regulator